MFLIAFVVVGVDIRSVFLVIKERFSAIGNVDQAHGHPHLLGIPFRISPVGMLAEKEVFHAVEFIIDYLQLVDISDSRDRQLDLDIALCHLKEFAKKLNIVIVALSNLFLGNERPERMPLIADHNEFKTIGKHADWSFFIYRPELYGNREGRNTCSIIISRDGNCPLSTTSLKYQWYTRRFNNN